MHKHIPPHIKAVFFDHDDTLVGTREVKWSQHKFIAKEYYGKDLLDDEILLHWGKPFPKMICLLYETEDVDQALSINYETAVNYQKILFPSTIPALLQLYSYNLTLGIVTATSFKSIDSDLSFHQFPRQIISYLQTADDTDFHKPDPKVFIPACNWLKAKGITPEEVLYIGDGIHDLMAAKGAGFNFLGVESGLTTEQQFKGHGALSIKSIADLLDI